MLTRFRSPGRAALLAAGLCILGAGPALAAEFCVSTPAGLQAAFDEAEINAQDDLVKLVSGLYQGSFRYSCPFPYTEAYSITVQGGWGPGCLERTDDPSLTVLDALGAGIPLSVSTVGYPLADLAVGNLTVTGGTYAGLNAVGGTVEVTGCVIVDNHGVDPGVSTVAVGGAFLKGTTALRVNGCLVSGNRSYGALVILEGAPGGGGIYVPESGSVEIRGCTFTGNETLQGYAGALLLNSCSSVLLDGNTFEGNLAEYVAGVYLDHCSNITVRGNLFNGNHDDWTGGLETYFSVDGDTVVEGNEFRDNSGTGILGGGGAARLSSPVHGGALMILGNVFEGNVATYGGGALSLGGAPLGGPYSSITVANNVFAGNVSLQGSAGALRISAVEPIIVTNNTFVGNSAAQRAGALQVVAGYSTCAIDVWNNIFRENTAPAAAEAELDNEVILFEVPVYVPLAVSHNEFDPAGILVAEPGYELAPTNIGPVDPLFVDAAGGDYRLAEGSPCIDRGSLDAPGLQATDADGLARLSGASVDQGAYETPAVNHEPQAVDDAALTHRDTPVAVDVLANDSDPDGDPLAIDSVTQGTYGGVTIDGGVVVYTPQAGWEGTDGFTYTVSDGRGGTDTATVSVTVTPLFAVSGRVRTGLGLPLRRVTMRLLKDGALVKTARTDRRGRFLLADVAPGSYLLKPVRTGWAFRKRRRAVEVTGADVLRQDFTATPR